VAQRKTFLARWGHVGGLRACHPGRDPAGRATLSARRRAGEPWLRRARSRSQGNMRLRTKDFEFIGAATSAAGAGSAHGRIGMVLEGGYNVKAIGPCALAVLGGLGKKLDDWRPDRPTAEECSSIEAAARIHGFEE